MPADVLANPFAQPGSPYVAVLLATLIAVTLAAILIHAWLRRPPGGPAPLLRKWLTWAIFAPLFALAAFAGSLATAVFAAVVAAVAVREYATLVDLPRTHRTLLVIAAVATVGLALGGPTAMLAGVPAFLFVGMLMPVVRGDIRRAMRDLAFGALGFAYLAVLLAHAVLMQTELQGGAGLLFATGVAVAFSDIGAYLVGRTFGRTPLAPTLSPNKTREGVVGNVLGAGIGYALLLPILPASLWPALVVLPFVVALAAIWGDLFESALKREFGTKDAGTWLPGFGGLLDRIDSFILVVPSAYYVLSLVATVRS